jgi:DNA polymerase III subunit delta
MEIKNIDELKKILDSGKNGFPISIYGVEKQLIKDCIKLIYNTVEIMPELNVIILAGDTINYDELVNACETLPMLSDKRVVHLKNPPFFKKNANTEGATEGEEVKKTGASSIDSSVDYLINYVKSMPTDTILLISYDDEIEAKNKLLTSIKANGLSLEFKQLKGDELKNYTLNIFEKNGKKISHSDLLYFIASTSNSFEAMEKEIQKLCMYAVNEENITRQHIDEVVHKGIENNIFKMVDSISLKNADIAISILDVLLFQKEEPLRILGMIIRQYRILYLIHLMLEQKKTLEEIKSNLRTKKINLFDFVLNNYIRQSQNHNGVGLRMAFNLCFEADCNIKISRTSPELILETLIVKLCK